LPIWNDTRFIPAKSTGADGCDGTLNPVVERCRSKVSRIYFRAVASFANPDIYWFLQAERIHCAIRLSANRILQQRLGHLLRRPIEPPPNEVRRSDANFIYQSASWTKPRRVIAKVEWHPGELYPHVAFIVTKLARSAENVITLAVPEPIKDWSLTGLKEKLIKIGAKFVGHGRRVAFRWC
jgi:hypothetical protein